MSDQTPAEIEAADMKKTIADMARNLATLSAELAKRPATNPLEHLVGAPANPLALPPGANGTYPILLTPLLHPHLLPDVIAQIGKFEFPPANLGRLLKTAAAPPQPVLLLVLGPNGEVQFTPATPVSGASALIRDIPDILTFVEAWSVFTSVMQNQRLSLPIAQAFTAHLNNIISIARVYSWPNVLDYHIAFIQLRTLDAFFNPILWIRSDPHLHTLHLLTPSLQPRPSTPPPAVLPPAAPMPPPRSAQVCFNYNSGGCGGVVAGCSRRHACRVCGGPHTALICPTAAAAAAAVAGAAPPSA
ncbi:hypothetical protein C8R45DRAFT_966053 [Mycena sanguinolenta]|nr:hypothetical protein C8R45DRAFT_1001354 [Mycena sanguinolenta]KAJ6482699.1 hypothetical protein C8R45DRAFT_1002191 [Mycena sanguinolenta]KAJ6511086.1 hypothetical protein C8R45DRAFT_966053 [Mycena sanguinolenta]